MSNIHAGDPGQACSAVTKALEHGNSARRMHMGIGETVDKTTWESIARGVVAVVILLVGVFLSARLCGASPGEDAVRSIFGSHSTPAGSIR